MRKHLLLALMCLMGITSVQKAYAEKEIYAVKNSTTMVLYYDDQKASRANVVEGWTPENGTSDMSWDDRYFFTTVELDASMQAARPTSTINWFKFMEHITGIVHLDYLNTSVVTDMSFMFFDCLSLTSLDVTHFNTANVTDMFCMFCRCTSLTSLDVIGFDVSNVTTMSSMFGDCSSLRTIYCNRDWSASTVLESFTNMFDKCTSLVGGNGTAFDTNVIDISYARPDKAGQPGYFTAVKEIYATLSNGTLTLYYDDQKHIHHDVLTEWTPSKGTNDLYNNVDKCLSIKQAVLDESMQNARPTTTYSWFYALPNLKEIIHLDYLNTEEVTTMWHMFRASSSLTELDVHRFNTAKVTNMNYMFAYCSKLETIKCNDDWSGVENSTYMFAGCEKLNGGNGTPFDTSHINAEYARPDKDGQNGYFTEIDTQGIEETPFDSPSRGEKILRDGKLYIIVGDKTYDARGIEVR